jgi:hypothetical protein
LLLAACRLLFAVCCSLCAACRCPLLWLSFASHLAYLISAALLLAHYSRTSPPIAITTARIIVIIPITQTLSQHD